VAADWRTRFGHPLFLLETFVDLQRFHGGVVPRGQLDGTGTDARVSTHQGRLQRRSRALGQKARERFDCRRENGRYVVPSEYVIRDCLVRIEPGALDRALNEWNRAWGASDEALAMDGKTMKNAVDETGRQTHIMSVVGHESKRSYAQKK